MQPIQEQQPGNSNNKYYVFTQHAFFYTLFFLAMIALVITSLLIIRQIHYLHQARQWINHTHQVINASNEIVIDLLKAETQQRAYLITGDDLYLSPYKANIEGTAAKLNHLKSLTQDNLNQLYLLNKAEQLLKKRMDLLSETIELKKTNAPTSDNLKYYSKLHAGNSLTEQIQTLLEQINYNDYQLLKTRNEKAGVLLKQISYIAICITLFILVLYLTALLIFKRQFQKNSRVEHHNKELQSILSGIIESADEMVAAVDLQRRYILFNNSYKDEIKRIFHKNIQIGMSLDEVAGDSPEKEKFLEGWRRTFNGEEFTNIIDFYSNENTYEISSNLLRDANNNIIAYSHIIRNITLIVKEAQSLKNLNNVLENEKAELKDRNKKIELLIEMSDTMQSCSNSAELINVLCNYCEKILNNSRGIIYILHPSREYLEAKSKWGNPQQKETLITPDQCWALKRSSIYIVNNPKDDLICYHIKSDLPISSYVCTPLMAQNSIFGLLYVETSGVDNKNSEMTPLIINAIAESASISIANVRLRETLSFQSIHDSLTGLYNRRYMEDFLTKEISRSKRNNKEIAILMCDIDHFKEFNDNYGHEAGDIVLKEISSSIQKMTRSSDVVCRYGGEEFLILLFETGLETAKTRAEIIRNSVGHKHVHYKSKSLGSISISIGISVFPLDGIVPDDLINAADKALFFAKKSGRNKIIVYQDIKNLSS